MKEQSYLEEYRFNWESLSVMASGISPIDSNQFLGGFKNEEEVTSFLKGYGFDITDPIQAAEIFGTFQEAIQFIRKYFLKEGNKEDGLDLTIPAKFYTLTSASDLFSMVSVGKENTKNLEDSIWAGVILKIMHVIIHVDKDLRTRYFSTTQMQIFDRFYKYVKRNEENELYLSSEDGDNIPLVDFQTKSKKSRDSTIIKLLHKKESVAEELFDRIGVRFITENKLDVLRVMRFLFENHVVMIHNIKPSRSFNSLFDLDEIKKRLFDIYREAKNNDSDVEEFKKKAISIVEECYAAEESGRNEHSSDDYRAIHFTCRQLIKYQNPFWDSFSKLRENAREDKTDFAQKILEMDTSSIAKDLRFFYPFEVQVTDQESYNKNTEGEAAHGEYKRMQLKSAMKRAFRTLIWYKKIDLEYFNDSAQEKK